MQRSPYNDDEQDEEKFDPEEYMECSQIDLPEEQRRRRLEDGQEVVSYYVGHYCANDGGQIHSSPMKPLPWRPLTLSLQICSALVYEKTSLVKESCMQCIEPVQDENNNNNNLDQQDEDNIFESCETIYAMSGKCESVLPAGTVSSVNRDACNYIEGIKIVRRDDIIETAARSRPSAVATAFIVISAFYDWYLRTRFLVKHDTLL